MKKYLLLIPVLLLLYSCNGRNEISSPGEKNFSYLTSDDLEIISPKYADDWKPGTTQTIKWKLSPEVEKVEIVLYRKNEVKLVLSYAYENKGSFSWKIPEDFPQSVHYRIQINAIDWSTISQTTKDFFIRKTEVPLLD